MGACPFNTIQLRGLPYMTFTRFSDFLTPFPAPLFAKSMYGLYRGGNKGLYVVARNFFLLLLDYSAWPCLGPA